jgi:hypothetical protein
VWFHLTLFFVNYVESGNTEGMKNDSGPSRTGVAEAKNNNMISVSELNA